MMQPVAMRAICAALGPLLVLSACAAEQEKLYAVPTPMAASEMPATGRHEQAISLYIAPEIGGLQTPFQYSVKGMGSCTVTIAAGPPLESAIENVTRAAFARVMRGGGLAQPLAGVDRHIAVQLDSLTMAPPEMRVRLSGYDTEADADLGLRVSVYDGQGRLLLRRALPAAGHGEIKAATSWSCAALGGDIESKAIGDAIRKLMQAYAQSVLDAPELTTAPD
ncbi:MAG TPA: hypothetical protein VMQ73_12845 [Methylomirabilota bacterium]|nr:hypothetical protein [Methylomirabilota bacterium]